MQQRRIGLIGAGVADAEMLEVAYRVGQRIAQQGATLVCGGLGGVMEAGSRGCFEAGGTVLGILPGRSASEANPYVTLPVVTDMGQARNVVIAHTAEVLIAVAGEYGTLSEIAIGLKLGRTIIGLGRWSEIPGVVAARSADDAVDRALAALEEG